MSHSKTPCVDGMHCRWYVLQSTEHCCVSDPSQRPSEVRQQLEQAQMPVQEAPNDEDVRQSYNFAPGYHGLIYRAGGPEHGGQHDDKEQETPEVNREVATGETKYKLQAMQWGKSLQRTSDFLFLVLIPPPGLVPFW